MHLLIQLNKDVHLWIKVKWLSSHSHPFHHIYFCVIDFPVTQSGIKEKVINDITMIPAKSGMCLQNLKHYT